MYNAFIQILISVAVILLFFVLVGGRKITMNVPCTIMFLAIGVFSVLSLLDVLF